MIKVEDILAKTNGGLDVIAFYYPEAAEASRTKKKFKLRPDEKTASATIKQYGDVWKVTDFGGDSRAMNAIDIAMSEEGLNFPQTICLLAERYGVERGLSAAINKPDIRKRPAEPEEEEGAVTFELNETISEAELRVLGPKVTAETCKKYSYFSVKSQTRIKNREAIILSSNENYPIFLRDCGTFKKIYQPLNPDKGYRFFYTGDKPQSFINGLSELEKQYKDYNRQLEKEFDNDPKNEDKPFVYTKLPEAIICSGERDALCAASLGYPALWFNSETYRLSGEEYQSIAKYVDKIYNIPDLDATGIRKGAELAMKFLDIYTIWLPSWLSGFKDMRGKPRKDLRDFVELKPNKRDFTNLLTVAMPMRFWDWKESRKGGWHYEINSEYLIHFLKHNGFSAIENKNAKGQRTLVRVKNNIVSEVYPKDIRRFLLQFLRERHEKIDLLNLVRNSPRASELALSDLDETEIDFTDFTASSQFFFFPNETWEVSSSGITQHKGGVNRYVWQEEVIPHHIKRTESAFNITFDAETGNPRIDIKNKRSSFFRYLINTSRVHWRRELEEQTASLTPEDRARYLLDNKFEIAGRLLDAEEAAEQEHHLANKIYTIGYMLHRHKSKSKPWCVFAMDNKIGASGEANGGTGKSFCFDSLRLFMRAVLLSGQNRKLTDNPHIYDRVTEHTDMVMVDDWVGGSDFRFFFDVITGDMTVNPKNNRSYEIEFAKSPKFVLTSNDTIRRNDQSTERRVLYAAFSDYYHTKTLSNDYEETRTIFDDFNKNLMSSDYSEEEWIDDINFFIDCCRFYIGSDRKIQPPMANIIKRNLLASMGGEAFLDWADVFFDAKGENVNTFITRKAVSTAWKENVQPRNTSPQALTRSIVAYCQYADHIIALNPKEVQDGHGRVIRKIDGKAEGMFFVQTKEIDPLHLINEDDDELTDNIPDEKKPF